MSTNREMIKAVADAAGISQVKANKAIGGVLNYIVQSISKGQSVSFKGFGKFYCSKREARKGRNPRTRQPIQIAPRVIPKFSAGRTFKKIVRESK